MEPTFLEEWLMEILVTLLLAVALAVMVAVGSLRQIVKNGLQERMAKAESWITWLVQDRISEARHSGRPIVKPPADIDTTEIEVSPLP